MSERLRPLLLLATVAFAANAAPGAAQAPDLRRAAMIADSLALIEREIGAIRSDEQGEVDTLRDGPITILAAQDLRGERIAAALPVARALLKARYGPWADSITGKLRLSGVRSDDLRGEWLTLEYMPGAGEACCRPSGLPSVHRGLPADSIGASLARASARTLWWRADSVLRTWVGTPDPGTRPERRAWEEAYVELVTSRSAPARACYEGELPKCAVALELVHIEAPALEWYSMAELSVVVKPEVWEVARRASSEPRARACTTIEDTPSCRLLAAGLPHWFVPPPTSPIPRTLLLASALERGGAGAFSRLVAHRGSPLAEQLSATAGVPIDTLIAGWRRDLLEAKPRTVAVAAASGWMAFGWSLVLIGLALRSSRWR